MNKNVRPPMGEQLYLHSYFVFVLGLLLISFPTIAQANDSQEKRFYFSMKNVAVKDVLRKIENESSYSFIYSDRDIEHLDDVSIDAAGSSVHEILNSCLKDTRLSYRVEDEVIVIKAQQPSQKRTVKGIVYDENGDPMPGVTYMLQGTNKGGLTSANGEYVIEVSEEFHKVDFSFIGYQTKTLSFAKREEGKNIKMEVALHELRDVVVTGIFQKSITTYTGAATTISADELKEMGNRNIVDKISFIDPGFFILENNVQGSNPNVLPDVEMRGNTSVPNVDDLRNENRAALNTPLVIIDGFEASLQELYDMNEFEVQSITLLKDASSTAIYGSRGANGVIVVTTKDPLPGKLRVTYNGQFNLEAPDLSSYDLLDAREKLALEEYAGLRNSLALAAIENYNGVINAINAGVNTDWMAQAVQNSWGQEHSLQIAGGDKTFRYSAAVRFNNNQGVMLESYRKTFNGTINLSYYHKNFRINNRLSIGETNSSNSPYGSFSSYVSMNPYLRPYDDSGNLIKSYRLLDNTSGTLAGNPLYNGQLNTYDLSKTFTVTNNLSVEWNLLQNELKVKGSLSISKINGEDDQFYPAEHTKFASSDYSSGEMIFRKGSYDYGVNNTLSYQSSLNVSYSKTLNEDHIIFAGISYRMAENESYRYGFQAEGFSNEDFDFLPLAVGYKLQAGPSGIESLTRSVSLINNINYSYKDRYYVDASLATDGSSQFGSDKKFAPFWSLGIGWNLHQEDFLKDSEVIDRLKVRASTGITGSQNFSSYQALQTYAYDVDNRYHRWFGAKLMSLGNDELKWQQNTKYNAGLEVDLFKKRLSFTFDTYLERTIGLVSSIDIPHANGFSSYVENVGEMKNTGIEAKLSVVALKNKNMMWSHTLGVAHNKNEVVSLSSAFIEAQAALNNSEVTSPKTQYIPGYSTNTLWVVPSLGIDPSTGEELFLDRNGNQTTEWDARDVIAYGLSTPLLQGNYNTNFSYQKFLLSLSFSYQVGGQAYNSTLIDKIENANMRYNVDSRVLYDRWKEPGDEVHFKGLNNTTQTYMSSRFVQDANTLRCNNLSLSYRMDKKDLHRWWGLNAIEGLNFTFSTSDLFYVSTVKRERGTAYPYSKQFSFSIQAMF